MGNLKVMFGTQSEASGFKYKVDEINEAPLWDKSKTNPREMGGFNFSNEENILRWLIRGDTVYDVEIPAGAELVDCKGVATPHGVFRCNKIIISNPRRVTDDMAMSFYEKSKMPELAYFKAMAGCAVMGYKNTARKILDEKVNSENIEVAIEEYEDFCKPHSGRKGEAKEESKELVDEIRDRLFEKLNERKPEEHF